MSNNFGDYGEFIDFLNLSYNNNFSIEYQIDQDLERHYTRCMTTCNKIRARKGLLFYYY